MISKKEREYIAKLETAVKASLAWLDKFGEHAPIAFGGEQELHDTLQEALAFKPTPNYAMLYLQVSAQQSVHADVRPDCLGQRYMPAGTTANRRCDTCLGTGKRR